MPPRNGGGHMPVGPSTSVARPATPRHGACQPEYAGRNQPSTPASPGPAPPTSSSPAFLLQPTRTPAAARTPLRRHAPRPGRCRRPTVPPVRCPTGPIPPHLRRSAAHLRLPAEASYLLDRSEEHTPALQSPMYLLF